MGCDLCNRGLAAEAFGVEPPEAVAILCDLPPRKPFALAPRPVARSTKQRLPALHCERHPAREPHESRQQHRSPEVPSPGLPSRQTPWPRLRDLQKQSEIQSPPRRRKGQESPSLRFPTGIGHIPRARRSATLLKRETLGIPLQRPTDRFVVSV